MTGLFTSYCLSSSVSDSLNAEQIKNINEIALLWGSIGGGFLTDVMDKVRKNYDQYVEKNCNKLLQYLLKNKKEIAKTDEEKDIITSYTVGISVFCGIMKKIEPLVMYNTNMLNSENIDVSEYTRNKVWSNMDIIVLRYNTGKIPSEVSLKSIFVMNDALKNIIIKIYKGFLGENGIKDITDNYISERLNSFLKLLNKFDDKSTLKKLFIKKIEEYTGKKSIINSMLYSMTEDDEFDYSNSQKEQWNYGNIRSNDDLFELYDSIKDMSHEAGYRILQI